MRALCDLALTSIKIGPSADSLLSKWGTTYALGTLSWYATPLFDGVTTSGAGTAYPSGAPEFTPSF